MFRYINFFFVLIYSKRYFILHYNPGDVSAAAVLGDPFGVFVDGAQFYRRQSTVHLRRPTCQHNNKKKNILVTNKINTDQNKRYHIRKTIYKHICLL